MGGNGSGTISKLMISSYDKVVFIPLIPTNYFDTKDPNVVIKPTPTLSSCEPDSLFMPRFLPIVGEYGDYCQMESIKKDKNTKYIEEYFGITIEQFVREVGKGNHTKQSYCKNDKADELAAMSGMFEHYEVYKALIKEGNKQMVAYEHLGLHAETLELLGFKEEDKDTGDKRYNRYYSHKELKKACVYSDGTWIRLVIGDKEESAYNPAGLIQKLKQYGESITIHSDLKKKSIYHYFASRALLLSNKLAKEAAKERVEREAKGLLELKVLSFEEYQTYKYAEKVSRIYSRFSDWAHLRYALGIGICDLLHLNNTMAHVNTSYMPSMGGGTFYTYLTNRVLNKVTEKIINEKLEDYDRGAYD